MITSRQRQLVEQGCILAAVVTAAIICVLSYIADRSYGGDFASSNQIDLLKGNLADNWSVFGALSADEVSFKQASGNVVAAEIHAKGPSWSEESSGVTYAVGLYDPAWYEFTGEFQPESNSSEGIAAQLEVHSARWRFLKKADPNREGGWKKIDIYFRPSDSYPGAEISCRFWGTGGVRTGKVFFRNIHIVKIAGEPPQKAVRFNLEKQEEARLGRPGNPTNPRKNIVPPRRRMRLRRFSGLAVTVLILCTIIGTCWRLLE